MLKMFFFLHHLDGQFGCFVLKNILKENILSSLISVFWMYNCENVVFWECSYEKDVVSYQFLFKFEALTAKSHFLTKTLCIGLDVKKLNTWSHFLLPSNYFHFNLTLHGEWPSGLRLCNQNQKVPTWNPTRCLAGLGWMQWLTSCEWSCFLNNYPKLAVGQPNSS